MSSTTRFQEVEREQLLRRLVDAGPSGLTVVTPNRRLAAGLARDYDARQSARGLASWETADILPLSAFVERLYDDGLYSDSASALPALLTAPQELVLWETVIEAAHGGHPLLAAASAAGLARDAWALAHAWRLAQRLRAVPGSDDARAFADWAWRYEGITARDRRTDRARLPEVVAPLVARRALRAPGAVVAYGFDIFTPQAGDFLAALAAAGTRVEASGPLERTGEARRVAFESAKDEIFAAARWARRRLEAALEAAGVARPGVRIGVVVPDLARMREPVRRIFSEVMEPGGTTRARGEGAAAPFNVSLGESLAAYPIVAAAMAALELARAATGGRVEFERASRLLRSPFIAGAEAELDARAQLDAELRRTLRRTVRVEALRKAIAKATATENRYRVPACPILSRRLGDLAAFARSDLAGAKRPGEWSRAMLRLLAAVGFPGERPLDSAEHQTLEKLHEAIAEFAALDRVCARMRCGEALARFQDIVAGMLFQPETPEVPVQILGVLESAGLEFDHLWVAGLTDEAWPLRSGPNPFLPVALQRAAGIPESSPADALALDVRLTRGWLGAAPEVVVSHALREEDRELLPSPLVRDIPAAPLEALALPAPATAAEAIRRERRMETLEDARGPALEGAAAVAGGTGLFRDQAACPFRAFAAHRLRADGLEALCSGPDASDRGRIVHAMLQKLMSDLDSKAKLDAASERDLQDRLVAAADHAIARQRYVSETSIEGRTARVERDRLVRLGREWLEKEKQRPAFDVVAIEQKRAVTFGGVTVNVKLDRMDRLHGEPGGRAILDYKTGPVNVAGWLGPRPDEPQLPLYALGGDEPIRAVAFACVKAGAMRFAGIASEGEPIPGVRPVTEQRVRAAEGYRSWDDLLRRWRAELDALGREFVSGEARVAPKNGDETCAQCGRRALCRIDEREAP
jgi:ATP-dependent helicase/nuclease subunit B